MPIESPPLSALVVDRALDSMARLLTAISAPQADDVGKMKLELRRLTYDEQVRGEKRKAGGSLIDRASSRVPPVAWSSLRILGRQEPSGRKT